MTLRSNNISQVVKPKNGSLIIRVSVLCFAMLIFFTDALFAQVINNTGAAISITNVVVVNTKDLENTAGILGNNGTLNLSGNFLNGGTTNGNGLYNLIGNWTNNGAFNPGSSTVTLYGSANQTIFNNSTGETFYNLTINNPGRIITQVALPGSTLGIQKDLLLSAGTLSLGTTTSNLTIGGKATITGSLIYNNTTTQTTSVGDILSGTGTIDMSGGALPHILNLAGATSNINSFITNPASLSTVNYNGTINQTVFSANNYRNLTISNSGIKTLQGNSIIGVNLNISGGTFDLGTSATALPILGSANIMGILSFNGTTAKTVSLTGNLGGTGSVDMSGGNMSHLLNLTGSTNSLGSYSSGTTSTVNYQRNADQSVFTSNDYRNLIISGSGVKTLYGDVTAKGVLTMSAGDINANGNTLAVTNSAIAAIVRTSGKVVGKLKRSIGITGSEYLYPIGSVSVYNPLKLTFQDLNSGPLTAEFKTGDIGIAGLPLDDDGNEIFDRFTTGYWSLTSFAPMSSGSFNVNVNWTGFSGVDLSSSIIKRNNGGNLELDGTHGALTGPELTRTILVNGISTTTTDLAIGKGRPRITNQPDNIDICEGSDAFFEVTARGRGTLTYQWQVRQNLVSVFTDISDVGVYTGTTTNKLILTGAPYSMNGYMYQCIITDGQGHSNITNSVLLTVNKIPIAVATPSAQNECPGLPFTNIVLTTSNDVPGTTFTWVRDNPAGIQTSMLMSGSAAGDQISGVFSNTTNAPVTVTFTITPTGPLTTYCIGLPITATVTVNPTPRVFVLLPNIIQCDSIITGIQLTSPSTFTSGLISFRYTVSTTPAGSVTGFTTPTGGLQNNHYITDRLVNHTDTFRVVTYRITPMSPLGCVDGPAQNVTVTVNPTPRAIPVNIKPAICFGGTSEIVLTTPTSMTSGVIKFDYNISFAGVPGDVTGNNIPGTDLVPGQKLMFSYQNSSPPSRMDSVNSVLFAIRPKVVGLGCNMGNIVTPQVQVHPKTIKFNYPLTNGTGILITKPLTCNISAGLAALRVILTKGADPYKIRWTGPVGYTNDSVDIKNLYSGKYTVRVTDNLGCYNDSAINVVPFTARPQIVVTPLLPNINVSCPGGSDGSFRVYVSSGITAPYFYWVVYNDVDTLPNYGVFTGNYNPSDPGTYKVYNNLKAGNYMLIIRDINGCEVPKITELKEPSPIVPNFQKYNYNGFNVSCKGYSNGSVLTQPTGGNGSYSYQWYSSTGIPLSVSTTTNLLDSVPAGKYYLRTTDLLNCIKIDSVILTEPDGMFVSASQVSSSPDNNTNISCNGGNEGFIKLTISGGSGVYIYSWTGPNGFTATTSEIYGLKAGVYTCMVKDLNGCILTPSPSFTLTEPTVLSIASTNSISDDGSFSINCNGGTGWINITVSGGSIGKYKYNWSTTNGSGIINGQKDQNALTVGTYHLVVTDSNKCVSTKDITLTQPPAFGIQLSATNITCQSPGFNNGSINLTVSGGVAPYTYLWSNGSVTEDISGLTQGYYRVKVSYNNSCFKTDSIKVNLPPPLSYTKILSDNNGFNISCFGLANGSIQINPSGGLAPFVYNWTGPGGFTATTQDISELKAGRYVLLITDNNFCTATETINLTEPGRLSMNFNLSQSTAGGYNINCAGDSTGYIGIEPLNQVKTVEYLWSDGIFGKTRTNLPAGDYNIIIVDANNCHASSTGSLTEPDSMKLVFDISQPFCPDKPDGEIRLDVTGGVKGADYSYKWSDNSSGRNISNIKKGFYKVIVKDQNGCSIKDSVRIDPLNETCLIIPNAISPNGDLINDVWNIGMIELYPEMEIKVFDRDGLSIWKSEKGYPQPWDGKRNGSSLPIDSYHYIIDLHNGTKPLVGNITIVR